VNKRIWINIFLFVVVILLSIIILSEKDKIEEELPSLSTIDPNNISKIEVLRKNLETLSFSKNEDEWKIDSPLQFQANSARIKSILNILTTKSYKTFNLNDISQFDLRSPRVILKLDKDNFSFGTTNPIDQKRYILFNETVHLIDDYLFPQLMVNAFFFVDTKLLPKNIDISSIEFPDNKFQKDNDKWVSSTNKYNEEEIIKIVSKWDKAIAVSVSEYKKGEDEGMVSVQALSGEKINFIIVKTGPYLILGREDIGIQYTLGGDDAIQMF